VLRAAGQTETTQENIQDWLEPDKGDPGFQLLTEEEIAAVIFFLFIFISTTYIIKFSIYLFSIFVLGLYFASLIRMTSSKLIRISEGLPSLLTSAALDISCYNHKEVFSLKRNSAFYRHCLTIIIKATTKRNCNYQPSF
jgi:hypothetical protein